MYGGAPMLGLKGLVIKSHGSSDSKEIMNAILQCIAFSENDINTKISESISVGSRINKKGGNNMEFEKLKGIISEVLNVDADEIKMETSFVDDLGADSLDVFQIIMGIEEEFEIEIDNEEAEKIVTVADAVEQIKNAIA